jgi:hypothetical protein
MNASDFAPARDGEIVACKVQLFIDSVPGQTKELPSLIEPNPDRKLGLFSSDAKP